ncbi:MAG: NAD(P)-dependent oxidoreductase [Tenuifilaceae bacterium]
MNIVFAEPIGLTQEQKRIFSEEMSILGNSVIYFDTIPVNQDDLLSRTKDSNILVVSNYQVSDAVINKSPELKLIAVAFTGVDHIPLKLCKERGIAICNAAGYSTNAVAELTIALAIDLFRKIVPFDSITRNNCTRNGFLGRELHEKTFGIIGFGAIGQKVAKIACAFGCKILAYSRTIKDDKDVSFVELDELLSKSDIVSIHLPLTDKTRYLLDESKFKLMKSNALLINTARGPIVDSLALTNALKVGIIAGAAIDVYEHEPPIENNHLLFDAPNTILLPHIGFATQEAIEKRSKIVLNNIKTWLEGKPENQV